MANEKSTSQPPSRKLTPKQELFIVEYAKDFNATQAALRAGYSPETARAQACRLLTKVGHLIEERKQAALRDAGGIAEPTQAPVSAIATLEQSLTLATALAFYDPRKLYDGENLKSPAQLTRRHALMLADFQIEESFTKVGEHAEHTGYTKKVRLVDRAPYLNMLLKWHRAFPSSKETPTPPPGPAFNPTNWDSEDWEAFKKLYQKSQQSTVIEAHGQPSGT